MKTEPKSDDNAKKQVALYCLCAVIVAIALLLVLAPARVPVPIRMIAGMGDLMAATFVLLAARQIPSKK